jgi:hypothetical protein
MGVAGVGLGYYYMDKVKQSQVGNVKSVKIQSQETTKK